jgi:hypothetical protein
MAELDDDLMNAHLAWLNSKGQEGNRLVLPGADLRGANLAGAGLIDAELSGANLSGADLYGTYLENAYLSRADFSGANLAKAEASGAQFVGATLHGAYCVKTDFIGADLTGADLSRAYLVGAYLSDTVLDGVNFIEADIDLVVSGQRFDVSRVAGMTGHIGSDASVVTVVGDGPERQITVAELVEVLNRRGANVSSCQRRANFDPAQGPLSVAEPCGSSGFIFTISVWRQSQRTKERTLCKYGKLVS